MNALWTRGQRLYCVFIKGIREMLRERLVLILSLVFAPLFVLLYYIITAGGSTTYGVVVINLDDGVTLESGQRVELGIQAADALNDVTYAGGQAILRIIPAASQSEAEQILRERAGAVFVIFPIDFTQRILEMQAGDRTQPVHIIFGGDLTNPYYMVAGTLAFSGLEGYIQQISGQASLIQYDERPLGGSGARTEFEIYMPGILIFAVIMLVFLAAMTAAREIESGTLRRLQLTRLSALEFLGGLSGALVLVGLAAEFLAFGTAILCGFRSQGPLWAAILIGALTSLAVIGAGLVTAAFSRSVSQAFVIANFPLGLFMFFSGVIYPLPKVELFHLGSQVISLYDILAPTHAVSALNKIFVLGSGFGEVRYELGALAVLSLMYFAVGVWLFQRRQLQVH